MDYGKYLFDLKQEETRGQEKAKADSGQRSQSSDRVQTMEITRSKLRESCRFLSNGDKVKVTLRFRGREMAHQELGCANAGNVVEGDLDRTRRGGAISENGRSTNGDGTGTEEIAEKVVTSKWRSVNSKVWSFYYSQLKNHQSPKQITDGIY